MLYRLMRIVTGQATDARIVANEAPAILKPIRLEAHKRRALPVVARHNVKGAMTLAAEARDLFGVHLLQRRRQRLEVVIGGVGPVQLRAHVAVLAITPSTAPDA